MHIPINPPWKDIPAKPEKLIPFPRFIPSISQGFKKVLNIAEKLHKIDEKSDIKKVYIELKNILEEFRNILINYKKNDYNEIINIIKKYKEKAPILKNILSAVIIMSERGKDDIKKRLDFLISESLKNINYFLTRINIIIDRL